MEEGNASGLQSDGNSGAGIEEQLEADLASPAEGKAGEVKAASPDVKRRWGRKDILAAEDPGTVLRLEVN